MGKVKALLSRDFFQDSPGIQRFLNVGSYRATSRKTGITEIGNTHIPDQRYTIAQEGEDARRKRGMAKGKFPEPKASMEGKVRFPIRKSLDNGEWTKPVILRFHRPKRR